MDWNSVGLIVIAAAVIAIAVRYWRLSRKTAIAIDENQRLVVRITNLEVDAEIVNRVAQPLWATVQASLVPELTHFHTPIMDALLVKLGPPFALSVEEEFELDRLLRERAMIVDEQITPRERAAARMLLDVMPRVREELELPPRVAVLQVVAVPKPQEDVGR